MSGGKALRRVAAHRVVDAGGSTWPMAVVSLDKGRVAGVRPLEGEPPMTEWLGGVITLRHEATGALSAWWNGIRLE